MGIYLLRAECNAKLDAQSSEAIGDLNEIRGIAGATLYPNGPGDDMGLQYAVFKERQRELCGMECGILITNCTKVTMESLKP